MQTFATQPLDLMQFINTKYHEPFIHVRIDLEKSLDVPRLIAALDRLTQAFPLLRCCYDSQKNIFVEQENLTGKDLLRIDAQGDKDTLLTESLDMRKQLLQLTLVQDTLYITLSHMVCDGSGMKQLLYLLCDLYNGASSKDWQDLMVRDFSQLTTGLSGNSGTIPMLLAMLGNYKNHVIYAKAPEQHAYVVERIVSKDTLDTIHTLAKKQGATLNDVFLAAYARALHQLYNLQKVNIPCTVDLRKYAKGQTGIANLTGTYNLNIKLQADEPFSKTLAATSTNLQKQKRTRNDIAGPRPLVAKYEKSSLESFLKLYGGMETSAFTDYTNLGVWDDQKLLFQDAPVKNVVGYSGLNKAPCFQVAVSSFHGEATISSLFQCSAVEKDKAVRLMDTILAELLSFATQAI